MSKKALIAVLCFAIVAAAAFAYLNLRGPAQYSRISPDGRAIEYSSMEVYLDEAEKSTGRHQVVFIGVDGVCWDIVDPMIERGLLPTLSKLRDEGATGPLRSVGAYYSPPAWVSMMTGFLPEHSGVYSFGKWDAEEQLMHTVSSLDVQVPSVWDVASGAGLRVGVTNVPVTHPVRPVNGIMVSGLMTPLEYDSRERTLNSRLVEFDGPFYDALDATSYSPRLISKTVLSVTTFVIVLYDTTDDDVENYDTAAVKVFPVGGEWQESDAVPVYTSPVNAYGSWFPINYRKGGEKRRIKKVACSIKVKYGGNRASVVVNVSPLLRSPSDEELQLTYPQSVGQDIDDAFGYYVISLAKSVERIHVGTDCTAKLASYFYNYDDWDLFLYVFQAPDNIQHIEGVSDNTELVYQRIDRFLAELVERLPEDVTLIIASDHGFKRYGHVISLNDHLAKFDLFRADKLGNVNYERTLVFHDQWYLYFNEALLTDEEFADREIPIDPGQSRREALIAHLKNIVTEIKDPKSRTLMPLELIDIPGGAVGTPPDMLVKGTYPGYFVEGADIAIKSGSVVRETRDRTAWFHQRDGIYLLWGNKIKQGVDTGVRDIVDIAPTILRLLDLPMATNFDGKVIEDAIRPEVLTQTRSYYLADYADLTPVYADSYEELESLEDKLRALGYVR